MLVNNLDDSLNNRAQVDPSSFIVCAEEHYY